VVATIYSVACVALRRQMALRCGCAWLKRVYVNDDVLLTHSLSRDAVAQAPGHLLFARLLLLTRTVGC